MTIRGIYRVAALVGLGIGAVTVLAAAERATFILTDGERLSGEVVFHTEARTNIRADKNEFNLKLSTGVEMPIPFDHVVYIDFVGGQPRPEELAALPDSGHLLTRRNGEAQTGRLVDMIGGTLVRWESDGRTSDIAITDVRRVYLKTGRVREIFNVQPAVPAPVNTPSAAPRRAPSQNRSTVTVRGAMNWTDTGISVRAGQTLWFDATGTVYWARDNSTSAGPDGGSNRATDYPVTAMPVGGLIGKVGPNGAPFAIGSSTANIRMPANGRLYLGVNDTEFDDNSGSFNVVINR